VRGIVLARELSLIDYGDVLVVPGYIEESYEKIEEGLESGIS
jgi:agmatinase